MKAKWRVLGSLVLLAGLAWVIDWRRLVASLAQVDWRLFALACAVLVLAQVISSWRWQMLAQVLGFGGPLRHYVAHYFVGMLFNQVLPTSVGGDVVRSLRLAADESASPPQSRRLAAFLSVFAERFSGLLMMLLLACVSALVCSQPLPGWMAAAVGTVGAGLLGALVVLIVLPRLDTTRGWSGWLAQRIGPFRRLIEMSRLFASRPVLLLTSLGVSLLVQVAGIVLAWLNARVLGLDVPLASLGVVVPLVGLLMLLPISVNGMGLRELGTVILLAPLGVESHLAVSLAVLNFAVTVVVSLAGLPCLLGRYPRTGAADSARPRRAAWEVSRYEDPVRGNSHQGRAGQPPAAA